MFDNMAVTGKALTHSRVGRCSCSEPYDKSTLGSRVIGQLLDSSNGKHRILIDIKHMDLKARVEYYKYVRDLWQHKGIRVPIIASHFGVSGKDLKLASATGLCPISDEYDEIAAPNYFYMTYSEGELSCFSASSYKPVVSGWFYPWSINLADEEIKYIYESDGIIGVTMEERVLGKGATNYVAKTWDERKRRVSHGNIVSAFLQKSSVTKYTAKDVDDFLVAEPLLRNIFHIVEKCGVGNSAAWDHISIGSDFDGVMNPIDVCATAEDIPKLRRMLVKFIPDFARFTGREDLMYGLSADEIVDRVFYKNGRDFIVKYFPN
jgi:microsomal dipeptidase-like Zn-dependent dipeptidase